MTTDTDSPIPAEQNTTGAPAQKPATDGYRDPVSSTPDASTARTRVPRTRVGELWVAAVAFATVLLILLIFVLENGQRSEVSFFGAHGHLPMGVALLLSAVVGVLLVALPGTARIVQLRLLDRRRRHPRSAIAPVGEDRTAASQDTENPPR